MIDTASNTVTATIPVGSNPLGIAITPDGHTAYVTDFSDDTVHVIDTATQAVTTTVNVGNGPLGIAITPDGRSVYVANRQPFDFPDTGDMSVIDTARNAVVATIPSAATRPGSPSARRRPRRVAGDCDGDGTVTINELLLSVNIALGTASSAQCPAADRVGRRRRDGQRAAHRGHARRWTAVRALSRAPRLARGVDIGVAPALRLSCRDAPAPCGLCCAASARAAAGGDRARARARRRARWSSRPRRRRRLRRSGSAAPGGRDDVAASWAARPRAGGCWRAARRIDAVVICPAIAGDADARRARPDAWQAGLDAGLRAPFFLAKHVGLRLRRPGGRLVFAIDGAAARRRTASPRVVRAALLRMVEALTRALPAPRCAVGGGRSAAGSRRAAEHRARRAAAHGRRPRGAAAPFSTSARAPRRG